VAGDQGKAARPAGHGGDGLWRRRAPPAGERIRRRRVHDQADRFQLSESAATPVGAAACARGVPVAGLRKSSLAVTLVIERNSMINCSAAKQKSERRAMYLSDARRAFGGFPGLAASAALNRRREAQAWGRSTGGGSASRPALQGSTRPPVCALAAAA